MNGQGEFLAASHEYNELGQLIEKNLHRDQGSQSFLQSIDYSYNIRGWLTGINKRDNGNDTDDAFFQELFYDSVATVSDFNCNAQYNGNIAATLWKNSKNGTQKGYGYTYDALNRLKAASYGERSGGAWNFGKYKVPEINYDYNGNITKLVRYGFCGQSYTCIDSLNYHYHSPGSNRLIGIIELADRYCGFRAVNTMPAYYYDANGNMNMDKNNGIEAIVYNHLNLPTKIEFENNRRIYYLYDAAGTKLRKYYYEDNRLMTTTDYSGPFVYTDHHPDYILTAEGRLKWDDHDSLFHPEYFIKDHLGNVRGLISSAPNARNPLQVNDYYPFGLEFFNEGSCDNQLKYNGKELQMEAKLEWYDYGARFYDPAIGRWHVVDPMAESASDWSPYRYGYNNPIKYSDPSGLLESTHTDEEGNVVAVYDDGDLGVYKHEGKGEEAAKDVEKNYSKDNTSAGGEKMGESLHSLSFADQSLYNETGEIKAADIKINFGSTELTDKVQGILDADPSLIDYAGKAGTNGDWDLKSKVSDGSLLYGKYASPRDAGNFAAGAVAQMSGIAPIAQFGFGAYNLTGNNKPLTAALTGAVGVLTVINPVLGLGTAHLIGKYGEDKLSQRSIDIGKQYIKNK